MEHQENKSVSTRTRYSSLSLEELKEHLVKSGVKGIMLAANAAKKADKKDVYTRLTYALLTFEREQLDMHIKDVEVQYKADKAKADEEFARTAAESFAEAKAAADKAVARLAKIQEQLKLGVANTTTEDVASVDDIPQECTDSINAD